MEIYAYLEAENFGCFSLLLAHQLFCKKPGSPQKEAHHPQLLLCETQGILDTANLNRRQTHTHTDTVPEPGCAVTAALFKFKAMEAKTCGQIQWVKVMHFSTLPSPIQPTYLHIHFHALILWRFGYLILEWIKSVFQTKMCLLVEKAKWILEKGNWLILSSRM